MPQKIRFSVVLALFCVVMSQGCQSQQRHATLDQFYGITWGTQQVQAIQLMRDSLHAVVDSVDADSSLIMFTGGAAFEIPVRLWDLWFVDHKFWCGGIDVHPHFVDEVLPTYRKIKHYLDSLYGPADKEDRLIELTQNDRKILREIRDLPNALKVTWQFRRDASKVPDAVILYIMKGSDISITYLNGDLASRAVQRHRSTNMPAP